MNTLRLTRWRRRALTVAAGMLSVGMMATMAVPAAADPTQPPAPPAGPIPSTSSGPHGTNGGLFKPPPGSITWAVQPSTRSGPDGRNTFTYTNIEPLTIINDYVAVTNFSQMPVTFSVYAEDAFNAPNGSLELLPAAQQPTDVGSWVKVAKNKITVPAGARVNEPFQLTVPKTASPGDHTGGIIAAVSIAAKSKTGANVTVDRRLAVPVFLRVSGPLHPVVTVESVSTGFHGTVNPFGGGGSNIAYTVHNTGNVRLDLSQALSITGPFGITLASSHPKAVSNLLPGSTLRINAHLSGVFPAGPLTANVRVVPAEVKGIPPARPVPAAVSRGAGMWATPWPQLLLLFVLVGGFFGVRWWLRRRKQHTQNVIAKAVAKAKREVTESLTGAGAGKSG